MKNKLKLLTFLCVPFMLLGCSEQGGSGNNSENNNQNQNNNNNNNENNENTENQEHEHQWVEDKWESNSTKHWHKCADSTCKEKKDEAEHSYGEWVIDTYATDVAQDNGSGGQNITKKNGSKHRNCTICNYKQTSEVTSYAPLNEPTEYTSKFNRQGYTIFDSAPEIRFTTTENLNFATQPRKSSNIEPWEVEGTYTTANCGIDYDIGSVKGGMKVRGNYTTDYEKKGFRIKFESKQNLFGLNNGKKFKKWVLFADVKDNSMLRNAMSFFMARELGKDTTAWTTDCTPVQLYINNQYWGLYLLAEQKEAKSGRLQIPEIPQKDYTGTDIGYAFELDRYAEEEAKKGDSGDPTFTVQYKPKADNKVLSSENHYQCEGKEITTYTMLTDVSSNSTGKSNQLSFIKTRVEQLYEILYRAANNQGLKEIKNNQLVDSTETDVQKCLAKSFDIDTFVNSYILNEVVVNPDIGYSSFYLSIDCSADGDQKLRLDNPWDFDTALGVRAGTLEDAKGMYAAECSNMWIRLMYKCSFFKNLVKAKWNEIREAQLFERALDMIQDYSINYREDYAKNFEKWPKTLGSNQETNHETRGIVQTLKSQYQAEQLVYAWFVDRVDYLEGVFGNKRPSLDPNAPDQNSVGNGGGTSGQNTQGGGQGQQWPTGGGQGQQWPTGGGQGTNTGTDYTSFKAGATKKRIEAESGTRSGSCQEKSKTGEGISNDKYVGDLNPNGGSVTFSYNSSKACEALLTVGLSARTGQDYKLTDLFDITVNETAFSSDVTVPKGSGSDFHCWTSVDAGKINLKAGANTIVFTAKQNSSNFDYIDLYIPN